MSFLAPLFLLGLIAAALPVIVHLFNRKKAVRRPFPAIKLLAASRDSSARSIRLRQRAVLGLRILAIAIMALALAKPTCEGGPEGTSGSQDDRLPAAVAIVLDQSGSMAYADWWARAKHKVEAHIDRLRPWDEVVLISTHPSAGPGRLDTDHAGALKMLKPLEPSHAQGELGAAIARATSLLAASKLPSKKLIYVGDLAAQELPANPQDLGGAQLSIDSVREASQSHPDNLGITDLSWAKTDAPGQWRIEASVRNYGPSAKAARLTLNLFDKTVSAQTTDPIEPGQTKQAQFLWQPPKDGATSPKGGIAARVSLAKDGFSPDDTWHFLLNTRSRIQVLIVNGEPSAMRDEDEVFFLTAALNPSKDMARGIVSTVVSPDALAEQQLERFDAVVLANVAAVDAPSAAGLEAFVKGGGGLLIAAGDQVDPEVYNMSLRAPAAAPSARAKAADRPPRPRRRHQAHSVWPSRQSAPYLSRLCRPGWRRDANHPHLQLHAV